MAYRYWPIDEEHNYDEIITYMERQVNPVVVIPGYAEGHLPFQEEPTPYVETWLERNFTMCGFWFIVVLAFAFSLAPIFV